MTDKSVFVVTIPAKSPNLLPGARHILSRHRTRSAAEKAARKQWLYADITHFDHIEVLELSAAEKPLS